MSGFVALVEFGDIGHVRKENVATRYLRENGLRNRRRPPEPLGILINDDLDAEGRIRVQMLRRSSSARLMKLRLSFAARSLYQAKKTTIFRMVTPIQTVHHAPRCHTRIGYSPLASPVIANPHRSNMRRDRSLRASARNAATPSSD